MFTGIIESTGKVADINEQSIEIETDISDLSLGDSIAVNGVCLTVAVLRSASFGTDLSEETMTRTAFGDLRSGDVVNLERPVRSDGRFGGHVVQGHVDATGTVKDLNERAGSVEMIIEVAPEMTRYMVEKGSVTVDGVSLTISSLSNNQFVVSLVPHTLASTNLSHRSPGDRVNIEVDVLAKYVERLLASGTAEAGEEE